MVIYFEEKDLVSFGNYLLSDTRAKMYDDAKEEFKDNENFVDMRGSVTHADMENWAYLESLKEKEE